MLWSQSNGTEETSTLAVLLEPRWLDQKILDVYSKLNDSMKLIRSDAETTKQSAPVPVRPRTQLQKPTWAEKFS